jgi:uncharacterized membrane protein
MVIVWIVVMIVMVVHVIVVVLVSYGVKMDDNDDGD